MSRYDSGLVAAFLEGYAVCPPTLVERLRYWRPLSGWRLIGLGTKNGWSGEMPLYQKGHMVTHPQGYGKRLETQRQL